jgi:hypothetical protein
VVAVTAPEKQPAGCQQGATLRGCMHEWPSHQGQLMRIPHPDASLPHIASASGANVKTSYEGADDLLHPNWKRGHLLLEKRTNRRVCNRQIVDRIILPSHFDNAIRVSPFSTPRQNPT